MRALIAACAACFALAPAWAGVGAWTLLPSPAGSGAINVIAADPNNAAVRYAATQGGMYVSHNGGASWLASSTGIAKTPAGYLSVSDLAVAGGMLYITPYYLQKSTDGGSTWQRTGWVTENPQALVLAVDLRAAGTVYAGSNRGVYKSSDAGATWTYLAGNLPVYALAVDPGNPSVLLRAVSSGIYRSVDSGVNWTQVNSQLSVRTFTFDPGNPRTVYAGTTGAGVWKSSDGGVSWSAINRCVPQGRCAPTTLDGEFVRRIIVAGSTVYLGSLNGLYKSVDGGASWTQANNGPIGVDTMMLDPLNRDTVIGAYGDKLYSYTYPGANDWDRIFDWAEASFPQFFPGHAATQAVSGYQARYYAATNTYLGALDGRVYVYGPAFGGLLYAGTTAELLALAAAAGY